MPKFAGWNAKLKHSLPWAHSSFSQIGAQKKKKNPVRKEIENIIQSRIYSCNNSINNTTCLSYVLHRAIITKVC